MQIIEEKYNWSGGFSNRSKTDYIVLHHAEAVKCTAQDIHSWHRANGWTGIGYHFFVRKDGTIYRGRPINVVGAHVQGMNSCSIGFVLRAIIIQKKRQCHKHKRNLLSSYVNI